VDRGGAASFLGEHAAHDQWTVAALVLFRWALTIAQCGRPKGSAGNLSPTKARSLDGAQRVAAERWPGIKLNISEQHIKMQPRRETVAEEIGDGTPLRSPTSRPTIESMDTLFIVVTVGVLVVLVIVAVAILGRSGKKW
jgi:hypothetical protein